MFVFFRSKTAICAIGVAAILVGIAIQPTYAQEMPSANLPEMGHTEFRQIFRDNPSLSSSDFKVFPADLRRYLAASEDISSAFSRMIDNRTFLFVVTRERGPVMVSKAALVTGSGRTLSPKKGIFWQPLHLPSFKKTILGWSVIVSDEHFHLQWNDELNALQSTYCGDVTPVSCMRQTTRIHRRLQELVLVEVTSERLEAWKEIWKGGEWLADPHKTDF
ncbi:hypothetical protein [Roseibium sp. Sym1]|uniref:hypothetical protein n=1 Tax=Roseibium sp. Sym1 TaxID=3016006 RepID=UPI0022B40FC3|nr:hypothetical protein [Roseibium sp. Sym1]